MAHLGQQDPKILAFDTSAAHISVALIGPGVFIDRTLDMARGQAERLMGVLDDVLSEGSCSYADLNAVGVGIGPGNFTGIRISVAAARGLALSLGIPAIGVSTFETMLETKHADGQADVLVSLRAPRDQTYVQRFRGNNAIGAPRLIDPADAPDDLDLGPDITVRGFMACDIAQRFGARAEESLPQQVATRIAQIAAQKLVAPGFDAAARPAPLYVRAPDAAPPRDAAPVILG